MLSIAGSDSGGGAGIQADLKAFAACGAHGMTAITAITAQNTVAVTAVYPISPEAIIEQVRAVAEDIGVDAVKIGMLGTVETIEAVVQGLELLGDAPVVLDPVMVAESGASLLDDSAQEALRTRLLPRVTVATPNVPEAVRLTGLSEDTPSDQLARAVHALGPTVAVVTGGHREQAVDLFFDGELELWRFPVSGIPTAPRMARDAPTPRRWRPSWPGGMSRSRRRGGRRRSLRRRFGGGCAAWAPAPGLSM